MAIELNFRYLSNEQLYAIVDTRIRDKKLASGYMTWLLRQEAHIRNLLQSGADSSIAVEWIKRTLNPEGPYCSISELHLLKEYFHNRMMWQTFVQVLKSKVGQSAMPAVYESILALFVGSDNFGLYEEAPLEGFLARRAFTSSSVQQMNTAIIARLCGDQGD